MFDPRQTLQSSRVHLGSSNLRLQVVLHLRCLGWNLNIRKRVFAQHCLILQCWWHTNWRLSHLSWVDISFQSNSAWDGFVDTTTATTVAKVQFHFQHRSLHQKEGTFFRDSSDLQSNTTICCTAWWPKFDVQHTRTKVVDHIF